MWIYSHIFGGRERNQSETETVCSIAPCDQYRNFTAAAFYFIDMLQIFRAIIAGIQCSSGLELKHLCQIFCFWFLLSFWCCRQFIWVTWLNVSCFCCIYDLSLIYSVFFFRSNIFPVINDVSVLSFTEWWLANIKVHDKKINRTTCDISIKSTTIKTWINHNPCVTDRSMKHLIKRQMQARLQFWTRIIIKFSPITLYHFFSLKS